MDNAKHIELEGRRYVILTRAEYERLAGLAKVAEMPPLPEPDVEGNYPAVEYARASIARSVVRDRVDHGLTQRVLAGIAGIRFETLCRIEAAKVSPNSATLAKIDRALAGARKDAARAQSARPKRAAKRPRKAS
jgi:DNA-binding XRE family transcriptional regulator